MRNITLAAAAWRPQATALSWAHQMALDSLPRELRQAEPTPFGLMSEAAIKIVGKLDGSATHGMLAYHMSRRIDSLSGERRWTLVD